MLAYIITILLIAIVIYCICKYEDSISRLRRRCNDLDNKVTDLQADRNASEAELANLLDAQFAMKLNAMNIGKAMLQEAIQRQQDLSDQGN